MEEAANAARAAYRCCLKRTAIQGHKTELGEREIDQGRIKMGEAIAGERRHPGIAGPEGLWTLRDSQATR